MQSYHGSLYRLLGTIAFVSLVLSPAHVRSQQKELPELTIATAVTAMAFAAVWVAEQLKHFEQEGIRAKITVAAADRPARRPSLGVQ